MEWVGVLSLSTVKNPCITSQLAFCILGSSSTDLKSKMFLLLFYAFIFNKYVKNLLYFLVNLWINIQVCRGSPGGSVVKNPPANAGDIPGSGRAAGGGNGNPLQYSCLGNSIDRDPDRLQSIGLQRVIHNWACIHASRSLDLYLSFKKQGS